MPEPVVVFAPRRPYQPQEKQKDFQSSENGVAPPPHSKWCQICAGPEDKPCLSRVPTTPSPSCPPDAKAAPGKRAWLPSTKKLPAQHSSVLLPNTTLPLASLTHRFVTLFSRNPIYAHSGCCCTSQPSLKSLQRRSFPRLNFHKPRVCRKPGRPRSNGFIECARRSLPTLTASATMRIR